MKKIYLLFLTVVVILLGSCIKDEKQLAKDEFSKYYNGKEEVVLNLEDNLYFENHILKKENFPHEYGTIIIYEKSVYYSLREVSKIRFINAISFYSCDFYGNNTEKVYTHELNTYGEVDVKTYKDSYYIEYKKDKLIYVDKYTISTGIYENIARGKDCDLSDYIPKEQSRYSVEVIKSITDRNKYEKFTITDLESGLVKTIDDDYLKNTIYIESLEKFYYAPKRADISNGHILLTYGIGPNFPWTFPHLVFEYDFDSNTLEYKLLVFPFDSVPIEIIYIG